MASKQITFFSYTKQDIKPVKKNTVYVVFIKDIQEFVGIDLNHYGSYNIGDKAEIPILNSIGLLKKGELKLDKN